MSKMLWMATVLAVAAALLAWNGMTQAENAPTTQPAASQPASAGKSAPAFTLTDMTGKSLSLADFKNKWVVLEWVNLECPFVKKFYGSGKMQELQKSYAAKGVVWLSICSSAEGKQGYLSAAGWQTAAKEKGINSTAILLDADGKVGRAYGAKTTPHMFVINPQGALVYAGGIDNKKSPDVADLATAHNYVAAALDAGLAGTPIAVHAAEPYGCGVKYNNK